MADKSTDPITQACREAAERAIDRCDHYIGTDGTCSVCIAAEIEKMVRPAIDVLEKFLRKECDPKDDGTCENELHQEAINALAPFRRKGREGR